MKNSVPVIVLTPVKNESWILSNFLKATSVFADLIIIADQNSSDNSREIALNFKKVILINIPNNEYNEAFRQELLITKARELVPGNKLLIALDADEFISANSLNSKEWRIMLNSEPGCTFAAERIDLLSPISKYISFPIYYLKFAFVDDGISSHIGRKVHSTRLPENHEQGTVYLSNFKIIHFSRIRRQLFWDKLAFYSMIENINQTSNFLGRIGRNSKNIYLYFEKTKAENTPNEWIESWHTKFEINLKEFQHQISNQFKIQIIKLFMEFGEKRFYLDDIWDTDWNAEVKNLKDNLSINETFLIKGPNAFYKLITSFAVFLWIIRKTNRTIDLASLKLMKWIRMGM